MIERGEKADLVLVDPPYGYNREVRGLPAMTDDEEGSLWAVEQMVRLLKPRGYLALWAGNKTAGEFAAAITQAGLPILQFIPWEKPNKPSWMAREYLIIAGYAARPSLTTLCCDTLPNDHPLREVHPSPKPAELMVPVIEALSRPGDLVADFFMGTAPVGVAAVKTGRRYLGVELAPKYFDAARKEVEKALCQRQPLLLAA
jgi:DNA modification methylase